MPVYIAMLRGINVSGQKLIKMERLRACFESAGFAEVKTYVQSGNVVFKTAKCAEAALGKKIAGKILADFGFEVSVLIRTPEQMGAILKGNPLARTTNGEAPGLYVTFLSDPAPKAAAEVLKKLAVASEQLVVDGREIYLYCPEGYGNTKVSNSAIEKKLSVQATTRNWKTVNALFEMAHA